MGFGIEVFFVKTKVFSACFKDSKIQFTIDSKGLPAINNLEEVESNILFKLIEKDLENYKEETSRDKAKDSLIASEPYSCQIIPINSYLLNAQAMTINSSIYFNKDYCLTWNDYRFEIRFLSSDAFKLQDLSD